MTNKTSILALIVALIALGLVIARPAGHESVPAKQESVFDHVMKTRTIRCGYAVWRPALWKEPNTEEIKGITHDIMEEIGKKLDIKIVWAEETGWGAIVEGLPTHRYDMICTGMAETTARAQAVNFSKAYLYAPQVMVVRHDETRLKHNQDLNDPQFRIAVLDGEAFSQTAPKQFPKAKIYSMPQMTDFSQMVQEVASGKADSTGVGMSDYVHYNLTNPHKLKLLNKDEPLQVYPLVLGIPQGDVALKNMIDAALDEMLNDGTIDRLARAYSESPDEFLLPAKPYASPTP